MSVIFNENNGFDPNLGRPAQRGLTTWLISKGLAKDARGANQLMLIIIVICLALTAYFFFKSF